MYLDFLRYIPLFYIDMKFFITCVLVCLQFFSLSAKEIRVLTLNVLNSVEHGGWNEYSWSKNDGKTRGQKVVEVILKSQADIVCIQEYTHNNEWIKEELERTTGEMWNIRILPRNCAIVSKFPIRPHGNMFLTPVQVEENKCINVISAHQFVYMYLPYAIHEGMPVEKACKEAACLNQGAYWKAMVEEVSMAQKKGEPVVLAGDFNEPSHLDYSTKAMKMGLVKTNRLSGLMSNLLLDCMHLKDAWVEKRIKENADECTLRGMTWSPTTWDYKKETDDQRIDFIYYTPENIVFVDAKLVGEIPVVEVVGDKVDIQVDRWPSDHRGILAVFNVYFK